MLFFAGKLDEVRAALRERGCEVETMESYRLLAVNIAKDARLVDVQEYLSMMAAQDVLDYEEAILRQ